MGALYRPELALKFRPADTQTLVWVGPCEMWGWRRWRRGHSESGLTQFFIFFLFLASWSRLLPMLEWLVALAMLHTLSEECCLRMRRSGCGCVPLPEAAQTRRGREEKDTKVKKERKKGK